MLANALVVPEEDAGLDPVLGDASHPGEVDVKDVMCGADIDEDANHEVGLLYVVVVYHGDVEKVLALVAVGERLSQLKQSPARRRLAISFRVSRLKVWEDGVVASV